MLSPEVQREVIRAYRDHPDFKGILQKYIDAKLMPNKNYDNLDMGNPVLNWCTQCGIRKVSKSHRQLCDWCGKIGGKPKASESQYQCITVYKYAKDGINPGSRCQRYAVKGSKYCFKHGGRIKRNQYRKNMYMFGRSVKVSKFYHTALGPTLTKYMEGLKDSAPKELYQVQEELSLARAAAMPAVKSYSDLMEWQENWQPVIQEQIEEKRKLLEAATAPEEKVALQEEIVQLQTKLIKLGQNISSASQSLQASLNKIVEMASKGNDIYLKHAKTIEVEQIELMVSQIVKIIYDECGLENQAIAERVEQSLRANVHLPGVEQKQDVGSSRKAEELMEAMASTMGFLTHEPD